MLIPRLGRLEECGTFFTMYAMIDICGLTKRYEGTVRSAVVRIVDGKVVSSDATAAARA